MTKEANCPFGHTHTYKKQYVPAMYRAEVKRYWHTAESSVEAEKNIVMDLLKTTRFVAITKVLRVCSRTLT